MHTVNLMTLYSSKTPIAIPLFTGLAGRPERGRVRAANR
jgi:hypothetical protein